MNSLSVQNNQNISHNHGFWTSNIYNTSGVAITNTGGMSANADGYIKTWHLGINLPGAGNLSYVAYPPFAYPTDAIKGSDGSTTSDHGAVRCYVEHSHNYEHLHYINSDGGNESRPNNYTYVVWKRIN